MRVARLAGRLAPSAVLAAPSLPALSLPAVSVAALSVAGFAQPAPAAADPIGACTSSAGVLVVVDFSHWGGQTDVGCDQKLTTGYDAMYAAGFITEGTQNDGPDLICRIGTAAAGPSSYEPDQAHESCVQTPSTSAYWSYWHADVSQNSWSYSRQGSMQYQPPAGGIDAWVFGSTNVSGTTGQPTFTPDQVRQAAESGGSGSISPVPPASTITSQATPTTSTSAGGPAGGPAPGGSTPASTAPPSPTPGTAPAAQPRGVTVPSAAPPPTAGAHPTTTRPKSKQAAAQTASGHGGTSTTTPSEPPGSNRASSGFVIVGSPAEKGRGSASGGPPAGFILGAALAATAAGAAGTIAWRRRQRAGGP